MSSISQAIDFATTVMHLKEDNTSSLEGECFERSDHFSFSSAGVPSSLLFGGLNAVDPKIAGEKI
jgi:Zn-dependent M28 family amino/carboxypeptidase